MKYLWIILVGLVIAGGLMLAVVLQPVEKDEPTQQSNANNEKPVVDQETTLQPGRYQAYQKSLVAAKGYNETILFFHASWCPECRAFEMAINDSTIPKGTQILKVDYDDSDSLKAQHGVTLQSTFVKVDDEGNQLSKWVGYGEDKSVDAILENT